MRRPRAAVAALAALAALACNPDDVVHRIDWFATMRHQRSIKPYARPIPRHEIEDALDQPVSPVRMFTLIGGISGCAIGAWLTLYMSYDWPLVLGGKPIGSVPPYVVIMFEMTILFGALSTILGILFNALFAARRLGTVAYDPRFTNDKFGIFVPSQPARAGQVESLLRGAGAEEIRRA